MTEDEAKTKWCPFARVLENGSLGNGNNRVQEKTGSEVRAPIASFCLGSTCMAWRTRHQWMDNAQESPDWVSYAPYAFEPGPGQEREDGFCGLAGAPQ